MKRLLFLLMMMQFTQLGYAACNATLTNTKDYTIQSDSLMLGGGGGVKPFLQMVKHMPILYN
ncbi:hypothetical protein O6V48_03345, partial [Salmonella enterica subsp. enterica]|nr:hypothetical protein [Salmonella enterica]